MTQIKLSPKVAAGLVLNLGTPDQRIKAAKFILDLTEQPKILNKQYISKMHVMFLDILAKHGIAYL